MVNYSGPLGGQNIRDALSDVKWTTTECLKKFTYYAKYSTRCLVLQALSLKLECIWETNQQRSSRGAGLVNIQIPRAIRTVMRLSQKLCKPARWCKIELSHWRF